VIVRELLSSHHSSVVLCCSRAGGKQGVRGMDPDCSQVL
jgi:hypothetical protein